MLGPRHYRLIFDHQRYRDQQGYATLKPGYQQAARSSSVTADCRNYRCRVEDQAHFGILRYGGQYCNWAGAASGQSLQVNMGLFGMPPRLR
jgi:hypothetical protein